MKFFLSFLLLLIPLSYAQSATEEKLLEAQGEIFPPDEQTLSDLAIETEVQEDVLHPEGEVNDWSLGSNDLPSEDFQ